MVGPRETGNNGEKKVDEGHYPMEDGHMVRITFPDRATEQRALAFMLGRFSGRALRSGEHLVSEAALEALASQNLEFTVKGKAKEEMAATQLENSKTIPSSGTEGPGQPARDSEFSPPAADAQAGSEEPNAASIALLQSWLAEDATDDPEEIRKAQAELEEFKRSINAERERAGSRRIYP